MGLGGIEAPPKKKLKQAQLNFCVATEKASNKRKLSDSSDGLSPKLFRKDSGSPGTLDKENLAANKVDKSKDAKANEPNNEVIVLDDESNDDAAENKGTESLKVVKEEKSSGDVCRGLDNDPVQSETEPTKLKPAEDTNGPLLPPGGELKVVSVGESDDSFSTDSAEPAGLKTENVQVEEKDSDGETANKTFKFDKLTYVQGDIDLVLSSEDEQTAEPDLKTPPNPKRKSTITPKSSAKKAERERQREEKLRLKIEKEELKRKEKEEKEKKKQEEQRLKEEEKRKKEEEKKRKEEAKEEERKRKEEERKKKEEAKEEEKRKKEEEKKKKEEMKEEDRRKKEEARLAEERKENLAKAAFTKFFKTEKPKLNLPKKDEVEAQSEKSDRPKFMPFPVKSDMRLAVHVRRTLTEEDKDVLSKALSGNIYRDTYLKELKNGRKPLTSPATWPLSDEQHDVIIVEFVEDEKMDTEQEAESRSRVNRQKAKLLQFHENRRPPYWGTWRKPSKMVGPRRPFGHDKILDYEVNSDSEWEDEEEGEDIEKEDGDSDKEEADDENVGENGYMLDNTFVPHGYLSDEEAAEGEDDDSVENQKLKLTVLKQEFDQELKSKTQRLQPRLLGCVFISNMTLEASKSIYEPLMKLRCKWDDQPIDVTSPITVECSPSPATSNAKFPSSMVEQLAKLIHGNRSSMKALISEFMSSCDKDSQLSAISKRAVFLKVKEIASKTYSAGCGRLVWTVHPDLCSRFGLEPIIDPPKILPVSPVVDQPKPKDSPLANFLKKTPTSQAPVKRISTTLVREGPSTLSSKGIVHVDTPRPKLTPHGSNVVAPPVKPIRRVPTTLLSSVAGPVNNKTFNVGEIDRLSNDPKANTGSAIIDIKDFNNEITPLPDEATGSVPYGPDSDVSHPVSTSIVTDSGTLVDTVKDANSAVVPASLACEPVPMETDPPSTSEADTVAGPTITDSPSGDAKLSPKGTNGHPKALATAPQTSDAKSHDHTSDGKLRNCNAVMSQATTGVLASTPQPTSSPGEAKQPASSSTIKPLTPTPARKRVPLITLSKSVSKTKKTISPKAKVSIADMFSRKPAKKEDTSKPTSLESTVIDLSTDSN